ncbi:MAG TPA: hypothetical protein VNM91_07580 [Dehalococcoidia bacterium]|nr:hypothetical protein [Dehalococcoidia bacterium]
MLRDRDDCNGDAARYAPCMVARNYEVEVDVPIPVLVFNGEQRLSRIAYLIAIEPGYAATADMVLAIIQACADEAGTTAAREGYRHVDAGTAASGWLATPITMLAYAANEATFQKIVDRTFPVCMARRHFSVRRPEPPPPPAKW